MPFESLTGGFCCVVRRCEMLCCLSSAVELLWVEGWRVGCLRFLLSDLWLTTLGEGSSFDLGM